MNFNTHINLQLEEIKENGLFKSERIITSSQGPVVQINNNEDVIIMCANNYLGLSAHPKVLEASKAYINKRGFGMSSVRFICGTQDVHKELEQKISHFVGMEDAILYAAAFDANGGVFEPLFTEKDAIISDELNHASIIDGVRLCKAKRYRYKNSDMNDLEKQLQASLGQRYRIIVTDGVFSMDGYIAKLDEICNLAEQYNALVMVDDSHATGFIGPTGRGTHEYHNVMGRVDIITSTFGKALGGAMGGFTAGKKNVIEMLRQRSRPYLFSNSISPIIAGATSAVIDLLSSTTVLRDTLHDNTNFFKLAIKEAGFTIKEGDSPIIPIMLFDAKLAQEFAKELLKEHIYAIGFFYPVVPKEQARIRVQISAAHTKEQLQKAIDGFIKVGKLLDVIS